MLVRKIRLARRVRNKEECEMNDSQFSHVFASHPQYKERKA